MCSTRNHILTTEHLNAPEHASRDRKKLMLTSPSKNSKMC